VKRESERADEIALEIQKFQGTNVFCSVRKRTSTWTCVMLIALMSILYDRPTRAHTLSLSMYIYIYARSFLFILFYLLVTRAICIRYLQGRLHRIRSLVNTARTTNCVRGVLFIYRLGLNLSVRPLSF
jgi:uncharacterized Tic20 family protein